MNRNVIDLIDSASARAEYQALLLSCVAAVGHIYTGEDYNRLYRSYLLSEFLPELVCGDVIELLVDRAL